MSLRPILIVALLSVASSGVALGQKAAATLPSANALNGLSFTFDAPHGQLSATGYSLKAAPLAATSTKITGTIEVTLTINLVSRFRRSTTFPCAITVLGGQIDPANEKVDGGLETASGVAMMASSNTATCTLTIPYAWTLQNDSTAVGGLVIAYAAAAVTPNGVTQRSTVQVTGVAALPATGSTTAFTFDAAL